MHFPGPEYQPEHDKERLTKQHDKVRDFMADGGWRTLDEIAFFTKSPAASVSAQLRHLRKPRFGGYIVEKRRRGDRFIGLYEYRVVPKEKAPIV